MRLHKGEVVERFLRALTNHLVLVLRPGEPGPRRQSGLALVGGWSRDVGPGLKDLGPQSVARLDHPYGDRLRLADLDRGAIRPALDSFDWCHRIPLYSGFRSHAPGGLEATKPARRERCARPGPRCRGAKLPRRRRTATHHSLSHGRGAEMVQKKLTSRQNGAKWTLMKRQR